MTRQIPTLDSTPFGVAHAATELIDVDGVSRLCDTGDVRARYRRPGPHATVVMPIPTPGRTGDDLDARWGSRRHELSRLGASESALEHLDHAIGQLAKCGYHALITADENDAAYCWLTGDTVRPMAHVGDVPALLPVVAEVDHRPLVIAAAVDRVGADIHLVDHAQLDTLDAVDGEDERIHKSSGDAADQARNQRHSEVLWTRNAAAVADRIRALAAERHASVVVLSGDRRAVDLVSEHVIEHSNMAVHVVRAGGRNEPDTTARLLSASIAAASTTQAEYTSERLGRLMEELGQRDRAIDGWAHTLESVIAGRAKSVLVDGARSVGHEHVDDALAAAVATGASIVVLDAPDIADGLAALLYSPLPQEATT